MRLTGSNVKTYSAADFNINPNIIHNDNGEILWCFTSFKASNINNKEENIGVLYLWHITHVCDCGFIVFINQIPNIAASISMTILLFVAAFVYTKIFMVIRNRERPGNPDPNVSAAEQSSSNRQSNRNFLKDIKFVKSCYLACRLRFSMFPWRNCYVSPL